MQDEEYEDDEGPICPVCRTEMSLTPNFMFWNCDVCGYQEKVERDEDE